MPKQKSSTQGGVLNAETTASPPALPSTNGENPSTLGTLDTTAPKSPNFQPTNRLRVARLTQAFAKKLMELGLAEWRKIALKTGEQGWAIWFPEAKWRVDPDTHELVPREEENGEKS